MLSPDPENFSPQSSRITSYLPAIPIYIPDLWHPESQDFIPRCSRDHFVSSPNLNSHLRSLNSEVPMLLSCFLPQSLKYWPPKSRLWARTSELGGLAVSLSIMASSPHRALTSKAPILMSNPKLRAPTPENLMSQTMLRSTTWINVEIEVWRHAQTC